MSKINDRSINVMACHYSQDGNETRCAGWLHNQLGVGNNISLRLQMFLSGDNTKIIVDGEQKERFDETFE